MHSERMKDRRAVTKQRKKKVGSDCTLQPIFKKLTLIQLGYRFKEEYLQLSGEVTKVLLPLLTTYLFEVKLSSCTSAKTAHGNRWNEEAPLRIQPLCVTRGRHFSHLGGGVGFPRSLLMLHVMDLLLLFLKKLINILKLFLSFNF